jgi:hypothetical protein
MELRESLSSGMPEKAGKKPGKKGERGGKQPGNNRATNRPRQVRTQKRGIGLHCYR